MHLRIREKIGGEEKKRIENLQYSSKVLIFEYSIQHGCMNLLKSDSKSDPSHLNRKSKNDHS